MHFHPYCKKVAPPCTPFTPLHWYVDGDALHEDQLYAVVKKTFLEVDLALSLDRAAAGPLRQIEKAVPLAGRGT